MSARNNMSWNPDIRRLIAAARRTPPAAAPSAAAPEAEAWMVFGMRVLLSISALLTLYIGPGGVVASSPWTWIVLGGYVLHSLTLLVIASYRAGFWHGPNIYWVDIVWYGAIVLATGGGTSPFFSFFLFAILATSFRHGFDAGARLTLGAVGIVTLSVMLVQGFQSFHILLLRATFLLALGYMIAFWGGLSVDQRRRLALLRDVSRLSNPRFGVQHTLDSLMDKILRYYGATTCTLLMQDSHQRWILNTAHHPRAGRAISRSRPDAADVQPLLALAPGAILYRGPGAGLLRLLPGGVCAVRLATGEKEWCKTDMDACGHVADLLDTDGFVSVSLPLRKGSGRIFVTGSRLRRGDATFLKHIVQQAFPVIETIDLLDRLASEAAFRERQTIARDLHDSTIQPYIGLRHAVAAIRNSAGEDSAVAPELDRLLAMCSDVIGDMRDFAQRFRSGRQEEPELLVALRRQLRQVQTFYGLDVMLEVQGEGVANDRMAAEVFQIVTEGISNICKHTRARTAGVVIEDAAGQLAIDIFNPVSDGAPAPKPFVPRSIAERVAAVGGTLDVEADGRQTLLRVRIPV